MKIKHMADCIDQFLRSLAPRHKGPWTLPAYRAAHDAACRKAGHAPMHANVPALMRVNHGRWMALCPVCKVGGMMTGRGWSEIRCFDCGAILQCHWPANVDGIEALLAKRPSPINQNWEPNETLEQLVADNIEHGVMLAGG